MFWAGSQRSDLTTRVCFCVCVRFVRCFAGGVSKSSQEGSENEWWHSAALRPAPHCNRLQVRPSLMSKSKRTLYVSQHVTSCGPFLKFYFFCSQGTAAHLSWFRPGRSKVTAELRRRQRHLQLQPWTESSCYRSVFHRLLNKVSFFMLKNETSFIFLPIGVDVTLFAHRYLTAMAHKCARRWCVFHLHIRYGGGVLLFRQSCQCGYGWHYSIPVWAHSGVRDRPAEYASARLWWQQFSVLLFWIFFN